MSAAETIGPSAAEVAGRRVLVVSPHYDDVPLALGQSLLDGALHVADRVDVRVVFGRTNWTVAVHPTRGRAPVVTAWRRAEEAAAALRFGYRVRAEALEEAILRTGSMNPETFRNEERDGGGGDGEARDPLLAPITELLEAWSHQAEVLWVPAGLGRHVDHRLVALAAVELVRRGVPHIAFYEDRPYTTYMDDEEIAEQLGELGIDLEPHEVSGPITDVPQRWVRRLYRSQMSDYFLQAQARDRASGGIETVWVPTGSA